MKKLLGFFVVGCGFALGFWSIVSSVQFPNKYEQSSIAPQQAPRDPAAIRRMYDFSNLQGSALQTALQHRLMDGARVVAENGNVGIEFGHFVLAAKNAGDKVFACQRYSKIVLEFEAEGVVFAGEKPTMEVSGACQMAENINTISPLWIPVARVLGEPVGDGEFDYKDQGGLQLKFTNVVQSWPKQWALVKMKMISDDNEVVEIDHHALRDRLRLNRPLVIQF